MKKKVLIIDKYNRIRIIKNYGKIYSINYFTYKINQNTLDKLKITKENLLKIKTVKKLLKYYNKNNNNNKINIEKLETLINEDSDCFYDGLELDFNLKDFNVYIDFENNYIFNNKDILNSNKVYNYYNKDLAKLNNVKYSDDLEKIFYKDCSFPKLKINNNDNTVIYNKIKYKIIEDNCYLDNYCLKKI